MTTPVEPTNPKTTRHLVGHATDGTYFGAVEITTRAADGQIVDVDWTAIDADADSPDAALEQLTASGEFPADLTDLVDERPCLDDADVDTYWTAQ